MLPSERNIDPGESLLPFDNSVDTTVCHLDSQAVTLTGAKDGDCADGGERCSSWSKPDPLLKLTASQLRSL